MYCTCGDIATCVLKPIFQNILRQEMHFIIKTSLCQVQLANWLRKGELQGEDYVVPFCILLVHYCRILLQCSCSALWNI